MPPQVNRPYKAGNSDAVAERIAELNRDQFGMSWSLPLEDGASALVPVVSVRDWLPRVALALDSEAGRAAVAKHCTSVTAVLDCAPVVGSFANLHTGRGITAAQATIAEQTSYSDKTIRKVLYVLRDLGLAKDMKTGRRLSTIEIAAAHAHHGGRQLNAASVWHLTVPRPSAATEAPLTPRRKSASLGRMNRAAHIAAAAEIKPETMSSPTSSDVVSGHLSSRTEVREDPYAGTDDFLLNESYVGKKSPTRAQSAHAGKNSRKKAKNARTGRDPRPLHLQLAAAGLAARIVVRGSITLDQWLSDHGIHIGAFADVLTRVGIDTARWSGVGIKTHLDVTSCAKGLDWPDRINNPLAFLQIRLAGLDWSGPAPGEFTDRKHRAGTSTAPRPNCELCGGGGWVLGLDGEAVEPVIWCKCPTDLTAKQAVVESLAAAAGTGTAGSAAGGQGVAIPAWRKARAALDLRNPRLRKQSPVSRPTFRRSRTSTPMHPTNFADPIPRLAADNAPAGHTDPISSVNRTSTDPRETEPAAGDQCMLCQKAPGTVRTSMPSQPLVCDPCWDSAGFAGVPAPAGTAAVGYPRAMSANRLR
ncbi:hypothetical protein ACQP0C_41580 (plasmid) [Nocardia sp. CA-129566]|uniref:hypothetical protein n=1 Tax=Nocardia sp. CA-129566 TaxID=3239976 RepID=UPI003D9611C0